MNILPGSNLLDIGILSLSEVDAAYFVSNDKTRSDARTNSKFKARSPQTGSKCEILIVEDERLIAETLKETLVENGHIVVDIKASAEDTIGFFQKNSADLLIIDIRLKGAIDGIQIALILHQTIKKVPIIFLTAFAAEHFPHLAALDSSLFVYMTKPYVDADLLAAIQKLAGQSDLPN
jgi:DNA-binding response OmpR family regulator